LIGTLALEVETAINQLPGFEQQHARYRDANSITVYINSMKKATLCCSVFFFFASYFNDNFSLL